MTKSEIIKCLTEFKKNNSSKYGIIELGLFGSYASEQNRADSDIDIVIETLNANPNNIVEIKKMLEEELELSVVMICYRAKMNPHMKKNIDKDAIFV
jgi:predicted nucleotidyltransferase